MKNEMPSNINRIQIPDDDMVNWIKALHEGGFSTEETDSMMTRLNEKYFDAKGGEIIEKELKEIKKRWKEKYKRGMTRDQEEYFRKGIAIRLRGE